MIQLQTETTRELLMFTWLCFILHVYIFLYTYPIFI